MAVVQALEVIFFSQEMGNEALHLPTLGIYLLRLESVNSAVK